MRLRQGVQVGSQLMRRAELGESPAAVAAQRVDARQPLGGFGMALGHRVWLASAATPGLSSMPDAYHLDHDAFIVYLVDDPISALARPVQPGGAQLLAARGARILAQAFDAAQDSLHVRLRDAAKILGDRGPNAQLKACHRP